MASLSPEVAFANRLLADWHHKPMVRLNPIAMAGTRADVERFIDRAVVECRLDPVRPSPSAHTRAVHREGLIIRHLGRRLHQWLSYMASGGHVASEQACRAIIAELMQQARGVRQEQTDGE